MEYDWQEHLLQSIGEAEKEGKPVLIMLAGINGAGKSTFYKHYLEETGYEFINADALHKEQSGCHAATGEQGYETARKVDGLINNRLSLRACKSVCVNLLPKTFQASDLETQS